MRPEEHEPPLEAMVGAEVSLTAEGLFRAYRSAIMAICLANVRNPHDAEDIMQEVFLKAIKGFHDVRDPRSIKAWLIQIARRMCIDHYRRKEPLAQVLPDAIEVKPANDGSAADRVHKAISKLPPDYRETISLYYLDGRSCASVAEVLGSTPEAIRARLVRGRLMLHDILGEDQP